MDLRTVASRVEWLEGAVKRLVKSVNLLQAAVAGESQHVPIQVAGPFAVGNQDVTVTWPNPWPDAGYAVIINIICGTNALGSLEATLKSGTKDINSCVVTVANTGASAVGTFVVDVVGIRT